MLEDSTLSTYSITTSPKKVFSRNCCLMMEVWWAINTDNSDKNVARMRNHLAYIHHLEFFDHLPRPDDLDDEMLDSAMEAAHAEAVNGLELGVVASLFGILGTDSVKDRFRAPVKGKSLNGEKNIFSLSQNYSKAIPMISKLLKKPFGHILIRICSKSSPT